MHNSEVIQFINIKMDYPGFYFTSLAVSTFQANKNLIPDIIKVAYKRPNPKVRLGH